MNPAAYTALSADALAALANRGLLRRAVKDLEREPPTVVAEDAAALTLAFATDACTVTLPDAGAQAARCTCPAGGVCRHILAGILFLQARAVAVAAPERPAVANGTAAPETPEAAGAPPAAPAPTPAAAAAGVTPAALRAWAGRTVFRQAESDLAVRPLAAIEETPALLTLRLESGETVYWPEGGNLAATICSCGQPAPCRHRVTAILAYQARLAGVAVTAPAALPEVSAATEQGRGALLADVAGAVEDLVAAGLTRLGAPAEGQLRTLAVTAHSLDLPRLEHLLRALADHVAWQLRRDVRADAAGLLAAAAQVYALAAALAAAGAQPPRALAGTHRDAYASLGPIDIVGLGAQAWRTRSGYAGLSVFFWEPAARRRLVWSDSRPAFYNGVRFDPAARYRAPGAWEDSAPPELIAGSRLRLSGARRTPGGRLSAHPGTRVTVLGPADLGACDLTGLAFADWRALAAHLAALPGAGLTEPDPLGDLVAVQPAAWGAPRYDPRRQALIRPLADASGQTIDLVQLHTATAPFAVDTLQAWDPARWDTWAILGRAHLAAGIELTPVALWQRRFLPPPVDTLALQVTLDRLPAAVAPPGGATPVPADSPLESDDAAGGEEYAAPVLAGPVAAGGAVGQALSAALAEVEALAERGLGAAGTAVESRLDEQAGRLRALGLPAAAAAPTALAAALAAARHQRAPEPRPAAAALLRAAYVLHLATTDLARTRTLQAFARPLAGPGR